MAPHLVVACMFAVAERNRPKEPKKPMRKHNAQNERMKRQFFAYLEEAKRMSRNSVDQVAAAIA
jgi:hypothetical protein